MTSRYWYTSCMHARSCTARRTMSVEKLTATVLLLVCCGLQVEAGVQNQGKRYRSY